MPSYRDIRTDTGGGGGGGVSAGAGAANRIVIVDATGAVVSAFDALTYDNSTKLWKLSAGVSGAAVEALVENTSNNANSTARVTAKTAGSSADPPTFRLDSGIGGSKWDLQNIVSILHLKWQANTGGTIYTYLRIDGVNGGIFLQHNGTTADSFKISNTAASGGLLAGVKFGGSALSAAKHMNFVTSVEAANGEMMNFVIYDYTAGAYKSVIRTGNRSGPPRLELLLSGGNVSLFGTGSYGGGEGVAFIGDAATDASTNPTGGVVVRSFGGVLKVRDPNGGDQVLSGQDREVSNANATLTIADKSVAQTGTLTADRTFTLPNAATVPIGHEVKCSVNAVAATGFKVIVSGDININGGASWNLDTDWESAIFKRYTNEWRVF